jgi:hypothetical protein
MPHSDPLRIIFNFIKSNPPFVTSESILIPHTAAHRDILKCAARGDSVDVFDEDVGRRLKGDISKKLYRMNATQDFELEFTVLED